LGACAPEQSANAGGFTIRFTFTRGWERADFVNVNLNVKVKVVDSGYRL